MARLQENREARAYRIYISDSLFASGEDKRLTVRYADLITNKKKDTRSGDEIALDVIKRLNIKFED